jgi:hypothetical protein
MECIHHIKLIVGLGNPGTQYTFIYYRMRRMQDAGTGIINQDIPFRWIPCMVAGLAYYLSMKTCRG